MKIATPSGLKIDASFYLYQNRRAADTLWDLTPSASFDDPFHDAFIRIQHHGFSSMPRTDCQKIKELLHLVSDADSISLFSSAWLMDPGS